MTEFPCSDELFSFIDHDPEKCMRYWDEHPLDSGWQCVNDHTGCLYNDGHNTCFHEGASTQPLEEEDR